jgi:hypothetical protein
MIDDTVTAANCATTTTTTGTGGATTGTGGATSGGGAAKFTARPPLVTKPGLGRCVKKTFKATVSGLLISNVVFSFGGRVIATRNEAPFTATVTPGTGKHTLTAYVTFSDTTPAKTLKIAVKSCASAKRSVTPAGTPGFTG